MASKNTKTLTKRQLTSSAAKMSKINKDIVEEVLYHYHQTLLDFLLNQNNNQGEREVKIRGWGTFKFDSKVSLFDKDEGRPNHHNYYISGIFFSSSRTVPEKWLKIRNSPNWESHYFKKIKHFDSPRTTFPTNSPNYDEICWNQNEIVLAIANATDIKKEVIRYVISAFKQVIFNFFMEKPDERFTRKIVLGQIGRIFWATTPRTRKWENRPKQYLAEKIIMIPAVRVGKEIKAYLQQIQIKKSAPA